ncbi:MAG: hypothetical protein IPQ16_12955 [Geobacteraceae bacterium]|nr:hypothetical protein [Geobacteraceae bacterium]
MPENQPVTSLHQWKFFRAGGFDQVLLESGDDLLALAELDKKLWSALSCPVNGVEFDKRTLQLIDTDNDGHIRVPELLAACEWAGACLSDRQLLAGGKPELLLSSIDGSSDEGKSVLNAARTLLSNLGKGDADRITLEDVCNNENMFALTRFNGDGIITPASADSVVLKDWIVDIMACMGSETDRSGEAGISREIVERFSGEASAWLAWNDDPLADIVNRLPEEGREEAIQLWHTLKPKVDDFFLRCSMASYDSRAITMMNSSDESLTALAQRNLSEAGDDIALLPLSAVTVESVLDLKSGINPAWSGKIMQLNSSILRPLIGEVASLSSVQWETLKEFVQAYEEWWSRRVETPATGLGVERLRQWSTDVPETAILSLIDRDLALKPEFEAIEQVERLIRYGRDLMTLANNFVSFRDFYAGRGKAIFQSGTLYMDGRSFDLCIAVTDVTKHALLASLSRVYLAYCDCVRNGGADKMTIAVAITNGDCDHLLVGRNGVFFDRQGQDWDATIVRIIEHPISLRQAFWAPYKRIAKTIGDQVQKMAAARSRAAEEKAATNAMQAGQKKDEPKPSQQAFDVGKFAGIFAAIGLALGALATAIVSIVSGFFKLPWWQMPLVILGIIALISGFSVVLACFKLRQRNLGRLLDANGWAVNTRARINIPFGASLTGLSRLPPGAVRKLSDPFEEKKTPWRIWVFLMLIVVALLLLWKMNLIPMY